MKYHIRPIRLEDAAGINELRRMPGVFENILGVPSERLADTEKFLAGLGAADHSLVAVAEPDGQGELVIGNCSLQVFPKPRCRHCATVGMMVHAGYQGQGVGSALLASVLDIADNWLKLIRVELEVFTDNSRAVALYEKFGFEREGVRRSASIRNGEYVDGLIMARLRNL